MRAECHLDVYPIATHTIMPGDGPVLDETLGETLQMLKKVFNNSTIVGNSAEGGNLFVVNDVICGQVVNEEEFLGVSLTPPKRVTHFPRLEDGNVPINTSWYGMFWEFPAFWGSHGPREDITPLTPDQSEKLIVFGKRILSRIQKTATAYSNVVQSGRAIFDDFFQQLWPYIDNNTANVVFQMVKRLWLIRIDQ
ncbi:hypothetical protein TNCV_1360581 [Trichonephila clavipes]|nr:hypothetical protein TNCV_1360581 [Trichonephila clavipes]